MLKTTEPDSVGKAVDILKGGGVAVIPTDTVYGIACLGSSKPGRKKLLDIKPRSTKKPIGFLIPQGFSPEKLEKFVKLTSKSQDLMKEHWPGALTIVFNRVFNRVFSKSELKTETFACADKAFGKKTVALRCPNHTWLLEVLESTGPLAATSANLHKEVPPQNLQELSPQIGSAVDIICDGGVLSDLASTVVDVTKPELKVLRKGALKI